MIFNPDPILEAAHDFSKMMARAPTIRVNPFYLYQLLGEKDVTGTGYVHVDPVGDETKWTLLGLAVVQDAKVDEWALEELPK